jgi:hypothetical protein
MDKGIYREVDIEEIEDGAFEAWGIVKLKVARGPETLVIKVRVASVPQETIDEIRKGAPRPNPKTMMLDPSNPDHAAMGVTVRQKGQILDFSDPDYIKAKEAFDLKFRNEVVGRGVASKLKLKSTGAIATTPAEIYKALEEQGLSGFHFNDIAQGVLNLTQWTEDEREAFTVEHSASEGVTGAK